MQITPVEDAFSRDEAPATDGSRIWADAPAAVTLVLIAVAALITRFWRLGERSIWLDEAWGWRSTLLSFRAMLDWSAASKDPPAYYIGLRYWVDVVGDGETALRAPSALAGAATIVLLAVVAWRIGGVIPALLVAALILPNGSAILFAQEARMYPVVGLLAVVAALATARFVARPDVVGALLFGAAEMVLVYTHYSGLIIMALHCALIAVYAVSRWSADGRRLLALGAVSAGAVVLTYVPWLPNLFKHSREGAIYIPSVDADIARDVARAALGLDEAGHMWIAVALIVAPFVAAALVRLRNEPRVTAIAVTACVPLVLLVYSIAWTPVFDLRQASPFTPAILFVVAVGIAEAARLAMKQAETVRAVLVAGGCVCLAIYVATMAREAVHTYDTEPIEDWRAAARDATAPGGTVYVWRRYMEPNLIYYTGDSADVRTVPLEVLNGAPPTHGPQLPGALVLSHESQDESDRIRGTLALSYRLGPGQRYPGVTVYLLYPR